MTMLAGVARTYQQPRCESLLFALMEDSKHPHFKEVQKLVMELPPAPGILQQ